MGELFGIWPVLEDSGFTHHKRVDATALSLVCTARLGPVNSGNRSPGLFPLRIVNDVSLECKYTSFFTIPNLRPHFQQLVTSIDHKKKTQQFSRVFFFI